MATSFFSFVFARQQRKLLAAITLVPFVALHHSISAHSQETRLQIRQDIDCKTVSSRFNWLSASCEAAPVKESQQRKSPFPPIQPYEEGHLQVSELHSIYYAIYGNPRGKPVIYFHGGPGGCSNPSMATYFDPKAYKIILVDQRGCGKSKPFAELRENTTPEIINDFEKLRKHLKIEKWQLFGGSWGSTLALSYAIKYPERVSELILRGIFLARKKEVAWTFLGEGANFIFPEEWDQFVNWIPKGERSDILEAYGRRLNGELGEEEMLRAVWKWTNWEGSILRLQPPTDRADRLNPFDPLKAKKYLPMARMENAFSLLDFFLPYDGYLLDERNLQRIRHLPTVIVQGRYDIVAPAVSAYELHRALPQSEFIVTLSGHSSKDDETVHHLISATERFKARA